jgi:hypothetical protein
MCRLLEEYLAEKELKSDEKTHHELLAKALFRRNDYDLFANTLKKRIHQLNELPNRGKAYFQERANYFHWLLLHPETEKMDKDNTWLVDYADSLYHYFALAALETGAEMQLVNRFLDLEQESGFAEACYQYASRSKDSQTLALWAGIFQLYRANVVAPERLESLKLLLFDTMHQLDEVEKRMALKLLSNFPVRMTNQGEYDFTAFIFGLLKKSVEDGLIVNLNDQLEPGHFVNLFIIACKSGEFDWAMAMLRQYEPSLPDKDRRIVLNLCQASLFYQKAQQSNRAEDYLLALQYSGTSPSRNHWRYNVRQRTLAVRACYALVLLKKEFGEELERQLKNFEGYLRKNNEFLPAVIKSYMDFNAHVRSLYRLATNPDTSKADVGKFLQKIEADENVHLRHWLKEAAEYLVQALRR